MQTQSNHSGHGHTQLPSIKIMTPSIRRVAQIFMPHQRQLRLGIDVGSSAVKMALLKTRANGTPLLLGFVIEPLPAAAVEAKQIRNPGLVNAAIKTACQKLQTRPRRAHLAIPSSSTTTRQITLPRNLSDAAIEARVNLAAESQISRAGEPLSVDYSIDKDNQVHFTATRQRNVTERAQLLTGTPLSAAGIDLEAHAVIRAVTVDSATAQDATIGVVDLGKDTLNLTVLRNGQLLHARDQVCHDAQGTSRQRADAVKRALSLLVGSGTVDQPKQLILCGGQAQHEALVTTIEQVTGIPVSSPDLRLLLEGQQPAVQRAFSAASTRLITAIGLALPSSSHVV